MADFWGCIPTEKRGQAFNDLGELYERLCGKKLAEPRGLRETPPPLPTIINAPLYEEEHQAELEKEVSRPPEHEEHMR